MIVIKCNSERWFFFLFILLFWVIIAMFVKIFFFPCYFSILLSASALLADHYCFSLASFLFPFFLPFLPVYPIALIESFSISAALPLSFGLALPVTLASFLPWVFLLLLSIVLPSASPPLLPLNLLHLLRNFPYLHHYFHLIPPCQHHH